MFVKYIQQETGTRVQIKGLGSGFVDQETGQEHNEPMFIHVTYVHHPAYSDSRLRPDSGPDEGQVARAKVLTEDLLEVVRAEHAKVKQIIEHQQMELHQAQVQYAAYSAYAVCINSLILRSFHTITCLLRGDSLVPCFISVCMSWCLPANSILFSRVT
ncbi:hypothetical protein BDW22DRAFT_416276 [Trametopsis cervina]|nr:hypothetical protein BDW22DRAFT_416276 [Trametopsis cervina]